MKGWILFALVVGWLLGNLCCVRIFRREILAGQLVLKNDYRLVHDKP